jgi:CheY-like chemotaxis protein
MNVLAAVGKHDRKRLLAPRAKGLRHSVSVARSPGELTSSFRTARPDVVVLDRQMSQRTGRAFLERLLAEDPSVPILIVEDIDDLEPDTLTRVAGLAGRASPATKRPGESGLAGHTLPALHHPASGRADAWRIAEFFGLSLAALARLLHRSPQAVHKTPDAPALQNRLSVLVRVATALTTLFGSPEKARVCSTRRTRTSTRHVRSNS